MKDLRDWLNEADPVANEPPLSDTDVQRMRQAIVAAADESHQWSFADWARGSWAAATVAIALTIAVGMSRWMTPTEHVHGVNADVASAANAPEPGTRRQVQLIAPGGTRVIWIFNADFNP
jgi:hypothetical protein